MERCEATGKQRPFISEVRGVVVLSQECCTFVQNNLAGSGQRDAEPGASKKVAVPRAGCPFQKLGVCFLLAVGSGTACLSQGGLFLPGDRHGPLPQWEALLSPECWKADGGLWAGGGPWLPTSLPFTTLPETGSQAPLSAPPSLPISANGSSTPLMSRAKIWGCPGPLFYFQMAHPFVKKFHWQPSKPICLFSLLPLSWSRTSPSLAQITTVASAPPPCGFVSAP